MEVNLAILSQINQFVIYRSADGVILRNQDLDGFAHTHLNNYRTAEWLISLSLKKKLPRDIPKYLLISLIRINENGVYKDKAVELLNNKKPKDKYVNSRK